MNIDDIERIELEISSDCNAACPGCARTQNLDILTPQNLTFEQIKTWFPDNRHIENKIFKLCGVLGDPIVNPECMEITKWLLDHGGYVHYSTNGGRNSADWWYELGVLSGRAKDDQLKVHFCVDGHRETNHIYRVNTVYDVVDRNMQAYSDGGHSTGGRAEASWIYIVFDHNEHELETARARAQELDFRFATRTGMRNTFHDWVAKIKKKDHVEKKVVTEEKKITTTGAKEHSKVEVVKELDKFIETYKEEPKSVDEDKIREVVDSISCKFYHDKEIFVAANSTLWPCCFLWDSAFKNKDGIMDKYSSFENDWNNLNKHGIEQILSTDYYMQTLADSFDPRHNIHVSRCIRTCAKNRAYHNEIKYV
jgi:MoaA/NifB/PqqE/SkfB family radical SAM enzyme